MNMQPPSRMLSQDSDSILDVARELHDASGRLGVLEAERQRIADEVTAFFDRIRDRAITIRDANESLSLMIIDLVEAM